MKLSQVDLIKISQKTNGRCFYCNKSGEVVDHFISKQKWIDWDLENTPLKGKLNNIENLFLACQKCNCSKNAKCPEDFIENSFKAWKRYHRANKRIGIWEKSDDNFYGFGGISPLWLEKEIDKRNILFYEI